MYSREVKNNAIDLWKSGLGYAQIQGKLNVKIPKSTLATWFKNLELPQATKKVLQNRRLENLERARKIALYSNKLRRDSYILGLRKANLHLSTALESKDVAKIVLTILYLAEGSKQQNGVLTLGNSDPEIISLFLRLLRTCYVIDESKLRCTVQCRADQNIRELQIFWMNITGIASDRFYKTQIDRRTTGKPTKKLNYRGVCRLNYFSGHVVNELKEISKIIMGP